MLYNSNWFSFPFCRSAIHVLLWSDFAGCTSSLKSKSNFLFNFLFFLINCCCFFSDGWSDRYDVVEGYEREAVGGLSVRIHSPYVHDFDSYYFALSPFTNHRNPWFREFWQWKFNCSLQSMSEIRSMAVDQRNKLLQLPRCTGKERLSDKHKQDTKMAFVIKAIWTMAYGLHSMHKALCPNSTVLCKQMIPVNGSVRSKASFFQF